MYHTMGNKRVRAHVEQQKLTQDKKRKINLISYMVLVMILFMLLLVCSNYTHKKREAVVAYFEEFHQTKGALVGIFLHSKDLPDIGAKNTVRSSEETKWRCVKSHGEAGLRLSANQC